MVQCPTWCSHPLYPHLPGTVPIAVTLVDRAVRGQAEVHAPEIKAKEQLHVSAQVLIPSLWTPARRIELQTAQASMRRGCSPKTREVLSGGTGPTWLCVVSALSDSIPSPRIGSLALRVEPWGRRMLRHLCDKSCAW